MKVLELAGKKRETIGKKSTKALRKEGLVPCVLYGQGENVHFSIPESELRPLIFTPHVYTLSIDIDGAKYEAVMQDIQYHPVKDNPLHIDFLRIIDDKPVTIGIPVVLEGLAAGVQAGGILILQQRKLKIRALKKDLPDTLKIDVTELELGSSIKVRDLTFDNIEILSPGSSVVAAVKLTRASKGMLDEEEEAEEATEEATEEKAEE